MPMSSPLPRNLASWMRRWPMRREKGQKGQREEEPKEREKGEEEQANQTKSSE